MYRKPSNPIAEKLLRIIQQSNDRMIIEKMCIATEIKYHTFMNVFDRKTVPAHMMKALLDCKIINKKDRDAYFDFYKEKVEPKAKKPGRKPKKKTKKKKDNNLLMEDDFDKNSEEYFEAEYTEQDKGDKEDFESKV